MSLWVPLVSGVLIGAVSGIGGAAVGAWMNGKAQLTALKLNINAEDNRIKLGERRRLYAQLMTRMVELEEAIDSYSHSDGKSDSEIESERDKIDLERLSTVHIVNEIQLVAPTDLASMADKLFTRYLNYIDKALAGTRDIVIPDDEMSDLQDKMQERMRDDLEY